MNQSGRANSVIDAMKEEPVKCIEQLNRENSDFPNERMAKNLAFSLESLSSDIFTEYIRFLFELIQNADDAGATDVVINVQSGHLVLAHNGEAFTARDVEALCSIGDGTKRADRTKTGYKGIGFKSVFGKSNHVAVFSNGFQFKFYKEYRHPKFRETPMPWQIIPEWTERGDYPQDVVALPEGTDWNVITVVAMAATGQLKQDLMELIGNGEVLLFLRSVKSIRVIGQLSAAIDRVQGRGTEAYTEVAIQKNGKVISEWITHTFGNIPVAPAVRTELALDEKTPKKLQEAQQAELSFAARVDKGKIKPLAANESLIYTYLPTKVRKFGFPFLLNGSFLTNAGREELHEDRKWNEWLMEQAGEKIVDWLALLANTKAYSDQILLLLPSDRPIGGNLERHFNEVYKQHAKQVTFVPGRNGQLLRACETLVDQTGLSEVDFISSETVVAYFNSTQGAELDEGSFIRTTVREPDRLKPLQAHFFKLDDLMSFFTHETFRNSHQPEQNFRLIKYFHVRYGSSQDLEEAEKLKHLPFIYAKGKTLRPPKHICFPSRADLSALEKEVKVIHTEVYEELQAFPEIIGWLKKLGVKEVSELRWLENEVLPKLDSLNFKEDYLNLTMSIFRLHRQRQLTDNHYSALVEFKFLCKDGIFRAARQCYLADAYLPELPLEQALPKLAYVDVSYIQKLGIPKVELKSFFLAVGISENIVLKSHNTDISWSWAGNMRYQSFIDTTYNDRSSNWSWHTGGLSESHAFRHFKEFSLMENCLISTAFAKRFFAGILDRYGDGKLREEAVKEVILLHGWSRNYNTRVLSFIKWFFKNEECYPGLDGKLHKGKEVYVNSEENRVIGRGVLPVFDCEAIVTDDWKELFGFKAHIELRDYLRVLEHIASERGAVKKPLQDKESVQKRIGLIYATLAKELQGYSPEKREVMRVWAENNKVLATDEEFAAPSELKWVKEGNVRMPKGRIRMLMVPDNCPTDGGFEELLRDLRVEVIDTFKVKAEGEHEDTAFKDRIKALVPFIALVASVRQAEDLTVALKRIETRMTKLKLLQCSGLSLVFTSAGEELPGDPMQCHRDGSTIRYKNRWDGKSTMYELVPELAKALDVPRLDMDLLRLLQSDLGEIEAFMVELGADVNELPAHVLNAAVRVLSPEDEEPDEENIPVSSKNHLAPEERYEPNRVARCKVLARLRELGFSTNGVDAQLSVVDGVTKDGIAYPLVIKSYTNTSFKFNIRPNEWAQLDKENAMFWVYRGNGNLVVLRLEELLEANKEFHVQFETETFGRDGMAKFAEAFRYVRNVHFQLDAPDFKMADALKDYRFNVRSGKALDKGNDSENLLH